MTAESEVTLKQALAHASRGWPVFPCRPGGKEPATRHGFHDATTDPAQIKRWWKHKPAANLAIATGLPGPDVLDVDQRAEEGSGFAAYDRLLRQGLLAGISAVVATPGGGLHAYFTGSEQPSGRIPRHHVDFKSTGGYVLAPPSRVNGKPYRLLDRQAESGTLDWPAIVSFLEPERRSLAWPGPAATGDMSHLTAWVERLREGNRNSGLFWAACRTMDAGQPGRLDDLAAAAARAGLDDREIVRTIASASRLAYPGVRAMLAAATRNHDPSDDDLDAAEQAWEPTGPPPARSSSPPPSNGTPGTSPAPAPCAARTPSTSPAPWPSATRTSSSPSGTGGCTQEPAPPASAPAS